MKRYVKSFTADSVFYGSDSDLVEAEVQSSPYEIASFDPSTGEELFAPKKMISAFAALTTWMTWAEKYPYCVCITAKSNKEARDLLMWVVDNEQKFSDMYNDCNIPYRLDYIINTCKNNMNKPNIIAFSGDQVDPFSLG